MSTLTPEAYKALPDEGKNAAVARALGWRKLRDPMAPQGSGRMHWCRPLPKGREATEKGPPPYVTAGDEDPFAGWQWLAKMAQALSKRKGNWGAHVTVEGFDFGWFVATSGIAGDQKTPSPHRAAGAAMAAAGLLTEEPSDG